MAWTGIGKGKGKSPAGFRRFRRRWFPHAVERGVANEVKHYIDFANRTYALDGFNVVSFQTVRRIAGTCVTGCAIVDYGPAGKPRAITGFTSRLAKCAEKARVKNFGWRKGIMKLPLGISLDLDNQWSYMKIHGDAGWEEYPSYFDIFIPQVLDVLDRLNLTITFFIVGRDAALEKNHAMLKLITARGHDVGNHSMSHDSWLHLFPREKIAEEINAAHDVISSVTGKRPIGFRGPGFCWSQVILNLLAEHGYTFDASILPTWLGPLGRMYYFWKSNLTKEDKKQRKELFGKFRRRFRPVKAFSCTLPSGKCILEIPVSTIPLLKVPFHLSYLLYLSRFSPAIMHAYLTVAIIYAKSPARPRVFYCIRSTWSEATRSPPLSFFPAWTCPRQEKPRCSHRSSGAYRPIST